MVLVPSNTGNPTNPSFPVIPVSTMFPFAIATTTEARPVSKKYAYVISCPGSSSVFPDGRSSGNKCGAKRIISALCNAPRIRFLYMLRDSIAPDIILLRTDRMVFCKTSTSTRKGLFACMRMKLYPDDMRQGSWLYVLYRTQGK